MRRSVTLLMPSRSAGAREKNAVGSATEGGGGEGTCACTRVARSWMRRGAVMTLLLKMMFWHVDLSALIEMICPILHKGVWLCLHGEPRLMKMGGLVCLMTSPNRKLASESVVCEGRTK